MRPIKQSAFILAALVMAFLPSMASAQVVSNVQQVSLSLLVGESITLGPPSTASISYAYNSLTNSAAATPATFTVPLSWSLLPGHTGVHIVSWINGNSNAGLYGGSGVAVIPSADFFLSSTDAQGNFNNALTPCTGSTSNGAVGFVIGGGCTPINLLMANTGNSFTDTLTFSSALQGLPNPLSPAGYTATLFFQAITF